MSKYLTLILILVALSAKSQEFSYNSAGFIHLKKVNSRACVVFGLDSVQFYFDPSIVIKQIKEYKRNNLSQKQANSVLLNDLVSNLTADLLIKDSIIFNSKDGMPDTASLQNKRLMAMNSIVPYLLMAGKAKVYDVKKHEFAGDIRVAQRQNGDYIGAFREFKFYFTNGRLFYQTSVYDWEH